MARLEYFVVADSVSIDQATNQVSVFNILEEIAAPKFPIVVQKCAALTLWQMEPGDDLKDFQASLCVHSSSSEKHRFDINFKSKGTRHRIIQRLQCLQIEQPGDLRFEMLLNGEHAADHIVTVKKNGDLTPVSNAEPKSDSGNT